MNLTPKQIKLFLALAESHSVTAAARACHVTQPTASMQLRTIAEVVGLPLYEISGRQFRLTDAGEALAATLLRVERTWEGFQQAIAELRGLERGRLRVAVVSTAKYFVPQFLADFCLAHPQIDVALEVLNRDGVVSRLRRHQDDLYVMSHPPEDLVLASHALMPNKLLLVAPKAHRLAGKGRLKWGELRGEKFILREPGSGTRWAMEQAFARSRFTPVAPMVLGSNEAIRGAVAGGMGVAVLSEHALPGGPELHGLVELSAPGFPIPAQWFAVYPAQQSLAPVAQAFLDHIVKLSRSTQVR
jgi:DNA-binding transcriptional LysR family regulator